MSPLTFLRRPVLQSTIIEESLRHLGEGSFLRFFFFFLLFYPPLAFTLIPSIVLPFLFALVTFEGQPRPPPFALVVSTFIVHIDNVVRQGSEGQVETAMVWPQILRIS